METKNIISLAERRKSMSEPVLRLSDLPMSVIKHELTHFLFNNCKKMLLLDAKILAALLGDENMTFAHVLDVPQHEMLWPGDAAVFYPELFASRLSGVDHIYDNKTFLAEHMRCETLRRCGGNYPLSAYFEYDFYRHMDNSAFLDSIFGDGGDDEVDTLNSELLLTQVYMGPEEIS